MTMERKIGEIFEYNGGWYQAVEQTEKSCKACYFYSDEGCFVSTGLGWCRHYSRNDNKSVIFKKLEKVGEPYECYVSKKGIIQVQDYLLVDSNHTVYNKIEGVYDYLDGKVVIEIKQNKEDMEEKEQCCDNRFEIIAKAKEALLKETNIARDEQEMAVIDNILFRCWQMGWLDKYDDTKHSNSESIGKNLKPFSLEAAKAGKPVCTRDGRKARIICFDLKNEDKTIVAAVGNDCFENLFCYTENGKLTNGIESDKDLMMLPEKKEGWVNLPKDTVYFDKKEIAERNCLQNYFTVKIEWEE